VCGVDDDLCSAEAAPPGLAQTGFFEAPLGFYERRRLRMSTWNTPRFLRSYGETVDGGLVLPRGLIDTVASLVEQAGSRLELADERASGQPQEFTAMVTRPPLDAVGGLRGRDLACWSPRPARVRP
jgi:hypothetical protein